MYNPSTPENYHIKTFGLCDFHTGYAYNLLIYFGKETSYQQDVPEGQSEKIFEYLLRPLGSGQHFLPIGTIQLTDLFLIYQQREFIILVL